MPELTPKQKATIRKVFQSLNPYLETNLEHVTHPDKLFYKGYLTVEDLRFIVYILDECLDEMNRPLPASYE